MDPGEIHAEAAGDLFNVRLSGSIQCHNFGEQPKDWPSIFKGMPC